MNKLLNPGQVIFAIGVGGLGILCIISGDFIIGRPPAWPAGFNVVPAIGYGTGVITIIAALLILMMHKKAGEAALLIASMIFLLSVLRQIPAFQNDWLNACKSLALFGGALVVASSLFRLHHKVFSAITISIKAKRVLVAIGAVFLGIFFITCGYAHFKFFEFVRDFIPAYIPFHSFWAYFTGVCLYAGGIGVIIPVTRAWAAMFSGIMVLGWFLLLHIPRFLANMSDASDRMGLCESFALAGIFLVLSAMSSKE